MIDAGKLTQEDADTYRIALGSEAQGAIYATITDPALSCGVPADEVVLTMTNHDALELAAQLLIGAVYIASDSDWRIYAWQELLRQRLYDTMLGQRTYTPRGES